MSQSIMDTIIKGKEELLPRVKYVEALPDYQLLIIFSNEEKKQFDVRPLLSLNGYKNLPAVFSQARVDFGTVVWPGDIDIAPEKLYLNSKPV